MASARTELFSRKKGGGIFTIVREDITTGAVFFVCSVTGTDAAGYGGNPDTPLATLGYAIGLCTASKGDRIYLMPGHAENLTAATSVNCNVAGIEIIGLGNGVFVPTFSTTAAAGSITVGAANVAIRNIKLLANFTGGTTTAFTIAAAGDGCTLDRVQCRDNAAGKEFLIHVSVATTVEDLLIKDCSFVGLAGESMTNSILFAGTSTNCTIRDTFIWVDSSDDVVDHLTAASINFCVYNCTIVNSDTDAAGYCLRYKSDGTGVAAGNFFAYNKVDAEVSVGAAAWWFQNFATNTIGTSSGVLDPAAGAAVP